MKLLILLSSILIVRTQAKNLKCTNGVYINDEYFDKIVLIPSPLQRIYYPNVDSENQVLYFSHTGEQRSVPGSIWTAHKTGRFDLRSHDMKAIKGNNDAYANTIDRKNKVLYSATSDGIYAYKYHNDTRYEYEFYGARGVKVAQIQYKDDVLYYTDYYNHLYIYANGKSTLFKELEKSQARKFIIDNDGDITFDNSSGLFLLKKGGQVQRYSVNYNSKYLNSLTLDANGKIYACFEYGLFKVKKDQLELEKVLDARYISGSFSGLTFDNDNNMIYSNYYSIVKLVPNDDCKKDKDEPESLSIWDNWEWSP